MSSRPNAKKSVITNGDMSAASITSAVTIIQDLCLISYGLSWSGSSPVGTAAVQVSNDYALNSDGSVNNAGTWTTLPFNISGVAVTALPVSGSTGTGFIDIDLTGAYAMRLVYTKGSGTGTLQAILNAKVS